MLSVPLAVRAMSTAWRTARAIRFCFARNVSASDRIGSALLKCALVCRAGVNAFQEGHRFGVALIEPAARRGGLERKTHLDVGGGEFTAGEPFAFSEFAFPER